MHNLNKKPPHWVLSNEGFQQEQKQEFQIFINCSLFYPNKKNIFLPQNVYLRSLF